MPDLYVDFLLCKTFGWTPDQVNDMDDFTVRVFVRFIEMENQMVARKVKTP